MAGSCLPFSTQVWVEVNPHLAGRLRHIQTMNKDVKQLLADNLDKFIGDAHGTAFSSNLDFENQKGIPQSTTGRARGRSNAIKIDSLEKIAAALGLEPWQLLHPDVSPQKSPVVQEGEEGFLFKRLTAERFNALDPEVRLFLEGRFLQLLEEEEALLKKRTAGG